MSNDLQNTQTSMTVEEVRGSLDSTDNGAVKNSIRNCLTVFQNDPKLELSLIHISLPLLFYQIKGEQNYDNEPEESTVRLWQP